MPLDAYASRIRANLYTAGTARYSGTSDSIDMNEDINTTTNQTGNVAALLANLKKESLGYKLIEVATAAEPQGRQAAVAAVLQAQVKALSKAFAYAKDQVD